ncbi:MAG: serine/threonine protein kinase, partial [Okeania sp. SIO2C9]|nr:serine/threonine protein kinase [Okeania sp. SIO2C9]
MTLHQPNDIIAQRYRIVAALGKGGMGITYEAEDLTNYRRVAIKAVSLQQVKDWKILELFEREAKVIANLHHPQIPKYLNYFYIDTEQDRCFY